MKREMKTPITTLSIVIVSLLLLSTFVFAAGSSTVSDRTTQNNTQQESTNQSEENQSEEADDSQNANRTNNETRNETTRQRLIRVRSHIHAAARNGTCDDFETRGERIACRLIRERLYSNESTDEDEEVDFDRQTPEACRALRNPTACIALYKKSQPCYKEQNREKDRCFKRAINVTRANLRDLPPEERKQKAREHLVLLLYELQERIEKANQDEKISDEDAAEIIDLIDEIKEDILNNKRRAEIIPKLNELKQKIRPFRTGEETE